MKIRNILLTCLTAALALSLTCGDALAKKRLTIATGYSGGVFYLLGAGMADILNKHSKTLGGTAQATAASSENIALIQAGEADFAFAILDVAQCAYFGEREYKKLGKMDNLRVVMLGHTGAFAPYVRKDSPIKSLADTASGKYSWGLMLGYSGYQLSKAGLYGYDIDIDKFPKKPAMNYAEQNAAWKDGTLDVQTCVSAHPAASILDSASAYPIRILGQTEDTLNKILAKYPYYVKEYIPGGIYTGQDEDVLTYACVYVMLCHKDTPDEVVTEYLKQILGNDLSVYHPAGKHFTKDHPHYKPLFTDAKMKMIPFHPAARKYLESIGVSKLSGGWD